jgi:hypothetical protein
MIRLALATFAFLAAGALTAAPEARQEVEGLLERLAQSGLPLLSQRRVVRRAEGARAPRRQARLPLWHYRIACLIKDDGNIDILGVFHGALDITRYQL